MGWQPFYAVRFDPGPLVKGEKGCAQTLSIYTVLIIALSMGAR